MSQKTARRARQEMRAAGFNPAAGKIARKEWAFSRLLARKAAQEPVKPKRVRKTRSQKLAESMERHPAGKAKTDA